MLDHQYALLYHVQCTILLPYSSGQANSPVESDPQRVPLASRSGRTKSTKSGVVHRLSRLTCWGCAGGRSKRTQNALTISNTTLAQAPATPRALPPPHSHSSDHIHHMLVIDETGPLTTAATKIPAKRNSPNLTNPSAASPTANNQALPNNDCRLNMNPARSSNNTDGRIDRNGAETDRELLEESSLPPRSPRSARSTAKQNSPEGSKSV